MLITDLHNHTKYSYDGSNTPEEIVENAVEHGVDVIGICDHQFSLGKHIDEYYSHLCRVQRRYENKIKVLTGLEIGMRPEPRDLLADAVYNFDYVLFECLDDARSMDWYEFLEWRRLFKCPVGLAHTDIFALGRRYGVDIFKELKKADIFWELNTSGNYPYYYDFLTNPEKRRIVAESGIAVSVGSDTHWIGEYRFKQLKRANMIVAQLGNPRVL